MNLKKSIPYALCLVLCAAPAANASILDFYIGASAGAGGQTYFADGDTSSSSATTYGAMFGVDIPLLRIEAEYNRLNTDDFATNLAMANVYFKFLPMPIISPYIGLGAGVQFDGKIKDFDIKADNNWAAQAMAGLTFDVPITDLYLDAEARAIYLNEITNDTRALHYDLRVKLRYVF
jgi:opacity protein-like surface antigen